MLQESSGAMCHRNPLVQCVTGILRCNVSQESFSAMCHRNSSVPCVTGILRSHVLQESFSAMCHRNPSVPCVSGILRCHVSQESYGAMCYMNYFVSWKKTPHPVVITNNDWGSLFQRLGHHLFLRGHRLQWEASPCYLQLLVNYIMNITS